MFPFWKDNLSFRRRKLGIQKANTKSFHITQVEQSKYLEIFSQILPLRKGNPSPWATINTHWFSAELGGEISIQLSSLWTGSVQILIALCKTGTLHTAENPRKKNWRQSKVVRVEGRVPCVTQHEGIPQGWRRRALGREKRWRRKIYWQGLHSCGLGLPERQVGWLWKRNWALDAESRLGRAGPPGEQLGTRAPRSALCWKAGKVKNRKLAKEEKDHVMGKPLCKESGGGRGGGFLPKSV